VPFVTEALWEKLREAGDAPLSPELMSAPWPDGAGLRRDEEAEAAVSLAQAVVSALRKLRQQNNVPERRPVAVTVALPGAPAVARLEAARELVMRLGAVERLDLGTDPVRPAGAAADVTEGIEVLLDLDGLVDRAAQHQDLGRTLEKLQSQLAAVSAKLENAGFTERAPPEVVARERARREELRAEAARVAGLLDALR